MSLRKLRLNGGNALFIDKLLACVRVVFFFFVLFLIRMHISPMTLLNICIRHGF